MHIVYMHQCLCGIRFAKLRWARVRDIEKSWVEGVMNRGEKEGARGRGRWGVSRKQTGSTSSKTNSLAKVKTFFPLLPWYSSVHLLLLFQRSTPLKLFLLQFLLFTYNQLCSEIGILSRSSFYSFINQTELDKGRTD